MKNKRFYIGFILFLINIILLICIFSYKPPTISNLNEYKSYYAKIPCEEYLSKCVGYCSGCEMELVDACNGYIIIDRIPYGYLIGFFLLFFSLIGSVIMSVNYEEKVE